jgi:hypothetical protein
LETNTKKATVLRLFVLCFLFIISEPSYAVVYYTLRDLYPNASFSFSAPGSFIVSKTFLMLSFIAVLSETIFLLPLEKTQFFRKDVFTGQNQTTHLFLVENLFDDSTFSLCRTAIDIDLFFLFAGMFSTAFSRTAHFWEGPFFLLLPGLLSKLFSRKYIPFFYFVIAILSIAYFYVATLSDNYLGLIPYVLL